MRVAALFTYPVKSCYRLEPTAVEVEPWGFAGDRRWLIVEPEELRQITQRELPALGRIHPSPTGRGLLLRAADMPDLQVPAPSGLPLAEVVVWRNRVAATPAGPEADAWVSKVIGTDACLMYLDDPTRRPVNPLVGRPDDRVSFADGYPVLLANAESLTALNDWLLEDGDEPVAMTRFRPNLVVEGAPAWAEDGWLGGRLQVGEVAFRAVRPCARCVLTTVDPETGDKGHQPLRVLGAHRRFPAGLLFGTNLIPDGRGTITVGDEVTVLTP
jgi:uncharacterized protein YcbX